MASGEWHLAPSHHNNDKYFCLKLKIQNQVSSRATRIMCIGYMFLVRYTRAQSTSRTVHDIWLCLNKLFSTQSASGSFFRHRYYRYGVSQQHRSAVLLQQ